MQLIIGRGRVTPDIVSEAPVWVNNCGAYIDWKKNKRNLRPSGRSDWQLIFITEGRGFFAEEGKNIEVPENTVVLYPPHVRQEYRFFAEDASSFRWVHYSGTLADEISRRLCRDSGRLCTIDISNPNLLTHIFTRMNEHTALGEQLSEVYLAGCLCELLGACETELKYAMHPADADMEAVCTYLKLNYAKSAPLDELARVAGLSKYHFIRRFSAFTGKTPIEYLTEIRIERAKELLSGDELSVRECAELLGYSDQFYFCRVFKKHVGISPAQYRRN